MHIAFVDSNTAALEAIKVASEEGHRVTYLQSSSPAFYRLSGQNLRLIECADQVVDGVATTSPAAVTAALARCHAEHPIDFATSQLDLTIEPVALACKTLDLPGTSPDGVLVARRKDLMRAALRDAGVASAGYAVADDEDQTVAAAAAIGYPVVIKPPSGTDSRLVSVARDEAEVRAACQHAECSLGALPAAWHGQMSRGYLVEEHLSGPLVSVEIGIAGERSYVFCISGRTRARKNEVIETGVHIPAELSAARSRECAGYALAVCRASGLDRGIFHIEMIVTARGPVLVEANARIMGGVLPSVYRYATGHNIYRAFVQLVSGASVTDRGGSGGKPPSSESRSGSAGKPSPGESRSGSAGKPSPGESRSGSAGKPPPGESRSGSVAKPPPGEEILPTIEGCVAGRRLIARAPGVMPAIWDIEEWLGGHGHAILRVDTPEVMGLGPRQPVGQGQVIARLILRGEDYAATARAARDILTRAEKSLGIELMHGEYDEEI